MSRSADCEMSRSADSGVMTVTSSVSATSVFLTGVELFWDENEGTREACLSCYDSILLLHESHYFPGMISILVLFALLNSECLSRSIIMVC